MELRKVFNFSDKKPGFLEIIEVCLNLGVGFYITWLVLPNYKKTTAQKPILNKSTWLKTWLYKVAFDFQFRLVIFWFTGEYNFFILNINIKY